MKRVRSYAVCVQPVPVDESTLRPAQAEEGHTGSGARVDHDAWQLRGKKLKPKPPECGPAVYISAAVSTGQRSDEVEVVRTAVRGTRGARRSCASGVVVHCEVVETSGAGAAIDATC